MLLDATTSRGLGSRGGVAIDLVTRFVEGATSRQFFACRVRVGHDRAVRPRALALLALLAPGPVALALVGPASCRDVDAPRTVTTEAGLGAANMDTSLASAIEAASADVDLEARVAATFATERGGAVPATGVDAGAILASAPRDMLLVAGGTFSMGADAKGEEDERPAHPVTLASFYLDRTEVTQRAYAEAVLARACLPPDPAILEKFGNRFKGPEKPIVGVSWFDAHAYCKYLGKRLPREAEFERAVRGADGRPYPWGSDPPTPAHAVFATSWTEDVGSRPAGKGPYGHDDLAGNVWEWMADDYDPLAYRRPGAAKGEPGTCPEILLAQDRLRREGKQGFTGSNPIPTECEKSIRGGAYNYDAFGLRATNRVHHPGRFKLLMTGFRCAKDL